MLVTPRSRAVKGISCINPMAPLLDTARGLLFDSVPMIAFTKLASTSWRRAVSSTTVSSFLASAGAAAGAARDAIYGAAIFAGDKISRFFGANFPAALPWDGDAGTDVSTTGSGFT